MTSSDFDRLFGAALGKEVTPFDYQRRLAEDPECKSRLINPEGIRGCKTTAVVSASRTDSSRSELAWLWNRVACREVLLCAADGRASESPSKWTSAEGKVQP